ncbi:hypothetical protein B0H10DRAFT_2433627 [Mycena sp. CBHHK59/15]|nr:hypothetical protein B0H10DRAFT_2433627 [Mycena sp. CBHHK59/15]
MRHGREEGDESARQRAAAPGHRPHRASGAVPVYVPSVDHPESCDLRGLEIEEGLCRWFLPGMGRLSLGPIRYPTSEDGPTRQGPCHLKF